MNDNIVFWLLGVHQVALLTHIDEICSETAKDVTEVYKSRIIRDMVGSNKRYAIWEMYSTNV